MATTERRETIIIENEHQQQHHLQAAPAPASRRPRARLDEDGCIDLLSVLQVVNQIDQEQAWAICYEICTLMKRLSTQATSTVTKTTTKTTTATTAQTTTSTSTTTTSTLTASHNEDDLKTAPTATAACAPIKSLAQVFLHRDGYAHEKSCLASQGGDGGQHQQQQQQRRRPAAATTNESELVASLGIALFWALDYGIPHDEERKLSLAMEYLILQSQSGAKLSLADIGELCVNRLAPRATRAHADRHYRAVCKSLVQDTIQLSIFLEKIYTASMVLSDISEQDLMMGELGEPLASLRALRIDDWARLWMHVIKELKQALSIT